MKLLTNGSRIFQNLVAMAALIIISGRRLIIIL
jgi:hypothetical protein